MPRDVASRLYPDRRGDDNQSGLGRADHARERLLASADPGRRLPRERERLRGLHWDRLELPVVTVV
jgi:hypothetical protein